MPRSPLPRSDASAGAGNAASDATPERGPQGAPIYTQILPATPDCVRGTLAKVVGALRAIGLTRHATELIELVLAEALNNIVEHAYAGPEAGEISLAILRDGPRLSLTLCDQGKPLPGGTLPPPRTARLDVTRSELPEGGFGWFLIHSLAHRLDHRRSGNDNHLLIELDLDTLEC